MQIQKGLVKYKDRNDILCTYGLTDDGKQYYFLDNTSMTNGNIIASTVLVEAIDPVVVASSIGVIDATGNVVIPFENKSIKPIMDGFLLVEIANSTTPSVVEANSMRSDPLAATKLVTTPASIKEHINAKMGAEGRFIFNDQFSEATVCDYDGNNILDGQYFSFIAIKNNDTLYLSKNTVDSPVLEFLINDRMFVSQTEDTALDVQNTNVTKETIDDAMQAEEKTVEFSTNDITEKDFESEIDADNDDYDVEEPLSVEPSVFDVSNAEVHISDESDVQDVVDEEDEEDEEDDPISVIPDSINQESFVQEESVEDSINSEQSLEDNSKEETIELPDEISNENEDTLNSNLDDLDFNMEFEGTVVPEEEFISEEKNINEPLEQEEYNEENVSAGIDTDLSEISLDSEVSDEMDVAFAHAINEESGIGSIDDNLPNIDVNEEEEFSKIDENQSVDDGVLDFKNDLFDMDMDLENDIFSDSVVHADKIDVDYNHEYEIKDSIIEDVASTMTNLINQNKKQRQIISSYEDKLNQAVVSYKKVVEKAKSQLRDSEILKSKLKNYETVVTKLETKLEVLENKIHSQDKVITSQSRELESLRLQVEGKEELVKILADAQTLLEQ